MINDLNSDLKKDSTLKSLKLKMNDDEKPKQAIQK